MGGIWGCWRSRLILLQGHSLSSLKGHGDPDNCLRIRKNSIVKKEKEDLENNLLLSLTSVPAKIMEQILMEPTSTHTKKKPKGLLGTDSTDSPRAYHTWPTWQLALRIRLVWWAREEQWMLFTLTSTGTVTVLQSTLSEQKWPEEAGYQVGGLLAGPPGSMDFDQQYKVQLTNIHHGVLQRSKLELILVSVFTENLEDGTKCTLSKVAGDTQTGGGACRRYPETVPWNGQSKGYPRARKTGRLKTSRSSINASTKSCTQHGITLLSI